MNHHENLRKYFQFQIEQSTEFLTIGFYLSDHSLKILKIHSNELDFITLTLYTNNWNYVVGTWVPIFQKG